LRNKKTEFYDFEYKLAAIECFTKHITDPYRPADYEMEPGAITRSKQL
jgi:hypothetical protein